jgi:hypothetical protein
MPARLSISALAGPAVSKAGRLDLVKRCHQGGLEGGLSVSLRATPDELVGALTEALGGPARRLKVLDVRTGAPMVLEVAWGAVHEKWELADLEALVHNLNDLLADEPESAAAVVLGEWEDMLQLWCVPKALLPRLLDRRLLDLARNRPMLERLAGRESSSTREA